MNLEDATIADDQVGDELLVLASNNTTVQGYLQISLTTQGTIQIRGTRTLVPWLLRKLAQDGWYVVLEHLRWCG